MPTVGTLAHMTLVIVQVVADMRALRLGTGAGLLNGNSGLETDNSDGIISASDAAHILPRDILERNISQTNDNI